jgi:hypothetical protein
MVGDGFGQKRLKTLMRLGGCLGDTGDLSQRKTGEQTTLVKNIVVLIRNTTCRCGKLEKSIVKHLHKKNENFGNRGVLVNDMMQNLNFTGEKRNEFLDALRRLEKRHIIRIMPI